MYYFLFRPFFFVSKVKVICQYESQIAWSNFSKKILSGGISVSQTHLAMTLKEKALENNLLKGENASFLTVFVTLNPLPDDKI